MLLEGLLLFMLFCARAERAVESFVVLNALASVVVAVIALVLGAVVVNALAVL